jgi:flavin-dependent dehydrogenase
MKTECNDSFCLAYFDTYIGGYGYAYIAAKDDVLSGEVDFFLNQPYEKYLQIFKNHLKKTKNIQFSTWSMVEDNYPEQVQLFKKAHGKTFVLAGALSGFHDPFFGFGVNSALVSGKIAATALIDKKKGMKEFKQFSEHLPGMYILSKIYRHIPFKDLVIPQLFKSSKSSIPIIGRNVQSIPGLTNEDCFKILHVE